MPETYVKIVHKFVKWIFKIVAKQPLQRHADQQTAVAMKTFAAYPNKI